MTMLSRFSAGRARGRVALLFLSALACSSGGSWVDAGPTTGSAGTTGAAGAGDITGAAGSGTPAGGRGGGGGTSGSTGGGGRGGAAGNCTWANGGGDPTPVPLQCDPPNWTTQPAAALDGDEIVFTANWCGTCRGGSLCVRSGSPSHLRLSVQGTWATLVEERQETCGEFTARLRPASGTSAGDVRLSGQFDGETQCHETLICLLSETYAISRGSGGVLSVVRRP